MLRLSSRLYSTPLLPPLAHLPEAVQAEPAGAHCVHDAGVVHHAHGDAALSGAQLQVGVRGGAAGGNGGEGGERRAEVGGSSHVATRASGLPQLTALGCMQTCRASKRCTELQAPLQCLLIPLSGYRTHPMRAPPKHTTPRPTPNPQPNPQPHAPPHPPCPLPHPNGSPTTRNATSVLSAPSRISSARCVSRWKAGSMYRYQMPGTVEARTGTSPQSVRIPQHPSPSPAPRKPFLCACMNVGMMHRTRSISRPAVQRSGPEAAACGGRCCVLCVVCWGPGPNSMAFGNPTPQQHHSRHPSAPQPAHRLHHLPVRHHNRLAVQRLLGWGAAEGEGAGARVFMHGRVRLQGARVQPVTTSLPYSAPKCNRERGCYQYSASWERQGLHELRAVAHPPLGMGEAAGVVSGSGAAGGRLGGPPCCSAACPLGGTGPGAQPRAFHAVVGNGGGVGLNHAQRSPIPTRVVAGVLSSSQFTTTRTSFSLLHSRMEV